MLSPPQPRFDSWSGKTFFLPVSALTGVFLFLLRSDLYWASLVAQMVKNLPAWQEIWVLSLSQEDPLEKARMATRSIILA